MRGGYTHEGGYERGTVWANSHRPRHASSPTSRVTCELPRWWTSDWTLARDRSRQVTCRNRPWWGERKGEGESLPGPESWGALGCQATESLCLAFEVTRAVAPTGSRISLSVCLSPSVYVQWSLSVPSPECCHILYIRIGNLWEGSTSVVYTVVWRNSVV